MTKINGTGCLSNYLAERNLNICLVQLPEKIALEIGFYRMLECFRAYAKFWDIAPFLDVIIC